MDGAIRYIRFFEKICISEITKINDRNTYFVLRRSVGRFFIGIFFTNSILTTLHLSVFTPVFFKKNKNKNKRHFNC
jgi:hypothetical protein